MNSNQYNSQPRPYMYPANTSTNNMNTSTTTSNNNSSSYGQRPSSSTPSSNVRKTPQSNNQGYTTTYYPQQQPNSTATNQSVVYIPQQQPQPTYVQPSQGGYITTQPVTFSPQPVPSSHLPNGGISNESIQLLVQTVQQQLDSTKQWKSSIDEQIQYMDMKLTTILEFVKKQNVNLQSMKDLENYEKLKNKVNNNQVTNNLNNTMNGLNALNNNNNNFTNQPTMNTPPRQPNSTATNQSVVYIPQQQQQQPQIVQQPQTTTPSMSMSTSQFLTNNTQNSNQFTNFVQPSAGSQQQQPTFTQVQFNPVPPSQNVITNNITTPNKFPQPTAHNDDFELEELSKELNNMKPTNSSYPSTFVNNNTPQPPTYQQQPVQYNQQMNQNNQSQPQQSNLDFEEIEKSVSFMVDIGFAEDSARNALIQMSGDRTKAINYLISNNK